MARGAGDGITAIVVMAEFIQSESFWGMIRSRGGSPMFDELLSQQGVKRYAQPIDIVHTVSLIVSLEANFISGQTLECVGSTTFH